MTLDKDALDRAINEVEHQDCASLQSAIPMAIKAYLAALPQAEKPEGVEPAAWRWRDDPVFSWNYTRHEPLNVNFRTVETLYSQASFTRLTQERDTAVEALRLYDEYAEMKVDRGGKNGPRGRAFAAFIAVKNEALASIEGQAK